MPALSSSETLARVLDAALARSPAQRLARRHAASRLVALAYHQIDNPDIFAMHLDWLVQHMRPVSLRDVLDACHGGPPLPENAVLVTFDDGHRSVLDVAAPLLRARGIPSVAFVVGGLLDTDQPFWWSEVEELSARGAEVTTWPGESGRALVRRLKGVPDDVRRDAIEELRSVTVAPASPMVQLRRADLLDLEAAGVAVGNHSLTHPCLARCSPDRVRVEILEAHRVLTEALGHPPEAFAYPDGSVSADVVAAVREAGYPLAFLFDHRLAKLPPPDVLLMSRVRVNATTSLDRFSIIVSGLHPGLHRARGRT